MSGETHFDFLLSPVFAFEFIKKPSKFRHNVLSTTRRVILERNENVLPKIPSIKNVRAANGNDAFYLRIGVLGEDTEEFTVVDSLEAAQFLEQHFILCNIRGFIRRIGERRVKMDVFRETCEVVVCFDPTNLVPVRNIHIGTL